MNETWKELLARSVRNVDGLRKVLPMSEEECQQMAGIIEKYPLCINPYYLGLVNPEDPNDPIRKMCIPDVSEFSEGGQTDTSGEADNTVIQGMQHKYRQTALILSTNQCAMYCRHCFRKRMVGSSSEETAKYIPEMVDYVRNHPEINNVLISGGDAFLNSNATIEEYLQQFCAVDSLGFIRFGTRIPVVLPQRIYEDAALLNLLETYGKKKQIIIVTQFNHPRELTGEAALGIQALKKVGCVIRNQTVLLKGVNDDSDVLAQLMNDLVSLGIIPYYIFQCRPVMGVKNQFQVPLRRGIGIVEGAKKHMSGQAKSVRYAMSHPTGKIEILASTGPTTILCKYHQAKYDKDHGRTFFLDADDTLCWPDTVNEQREKELYAIR